MTHYLGDQKQVILHQAVQGTIRAIRAIQNTWVFLMETRPVVLATVPFWARFYDSASMKTRPQPVHAGFVPNGSLNYKTGQVQNWTHC
jgi:hypothetical protein